MANSADYRRAHLKEYAQYQRNSRERHPKRHMLYDAKARAKRNGTPFEVSLDDIDWPTHCPVLGLELIYGCTAEEGRRFNSATLDRKINSLGYVKGNVFVISHRANRMKADASIPDLQAIIRYMQS
jgi:hypothetical protein